MGVSKVNLMKEGENIVQSSNKIKEVVNVIKEVGGIISKEVVVSKVIINL